MLLFQDFGGMILLVSDVYALQTMYVPWQSRFVNVSFTGLYDLNEAVVNEDVLLLCLH